MDNKTHAKIDRMTRVAQPFLWNLAPEYNSDGTRVDAPPKDNKMRDIQHSRKQSVFLWLKDNGFQVREKDNYEAWLNAICNPETVEQVFKKLVIPELKRRIGAGAIEELRRWWMDGLIPDKRFVQSCNKRFKINIEKDAKAVLEVHFRFGYVHQFGPLAPIIFEDAAEWAEEEGLLARLPSE